MRSTGLTDGQRCYASEREDSRGDETDEEKGVLDIDGHTPQLDMDDGHSQHQFNCGETDEHRYQPSVLPSKLGCT